MWAADPAYIEAALDGMKQRYGSIDAYMRTALGLSPAPGMLVDEEQGTPGSGSVFGHMLLTAPTGSLPTSTMPRAPRSPQRR